MLGLISKIFVVFAVWFFMQSFQEFGEKLFIAFVTSSVTLPSARLRHFQEVSEKPSAHSYNPSSKLLTTLAVQQENNFPDNFLFGVSTSAYQIEGAWNVDGKSASTWDHYVHSHPELIADGTNADVAADSYHLYRDDIDAVNHVGFNQYRFSIAWTRILPNGTSVNQAGVDYYHKLIDEVIARNITPVVTIFHWDLPQWLQDIGGLTNPIFVDYFVAYADVVFREYGSKVKKWITVNEPYNYCIISYGFGKWAPGIKSPGVGDYLCGHNVLLGHAAVYHLYRDKYFKQFGGEVGITLEMTYYLDSKVTPEEHRRAMQYRLGWFADPIFGVDGGYPQVMVDEIGNRSVIEGRPFSRFPEMTEEQKKFIKGTSDFFGINYYTSAFIDIDKSEHDPRAEPSWFADSRVLESTDPTWKRAATLWLYSVPEGLRGFLNWIRVEYNNPPVLVTETGWSDDGRMDDDDRIEYFNSHLLAVSKAINVDGCNVIGYTAWSLMDSFEWNSGYTINYGLYHVNYTSPEKQRIPKKSVSFFQNVIKDRAVLILS